MPRPKRLQRRAAAHRPATNPENAVKRPFMKYLTHQSLPETALAVLGELHRRSLAGLPESIKPETTKMLARCAANVTFDLFPDLDIESRAALCRTTEEMLQETPGTDDRMPASTRLGAVLAHARNEPGMDENTANRAVHHALVYTRSILAGCKNENWKGDMPRPDDKPPGQGGIWSLESAIEAAVYITGREFDDQGESRLPILTFTRLELGLRRELAKVSGRGEPPVHTCTNNPGYQRSTGINRLSRAIEKTAGWYE